MSEPLCFPGRFAAWRGALPLFSELVGTVVAQEPVQVEPALEALEAARKQGLFAAGYFAFELGYALEPRLTGAMPGNCSLPLLWFGLFRTQQEFAGGFVA